MQTEKKMTGYPSIDKPWLKYYSEKAINTPTPECSIYDYIRNCNIDNMEKIAMNYYGTDITYGSMFNKIDKMAGVLQNAGIMKNEVVTVCMVNSPDTVCLLFALNKIGAVANMVYGADSEEELREHILDANSKIAFILDMFQDKFLSIADECGISKIVVTNITACMAPVTRIAARMFKGLKPKKLPADSRFVSWKIFFNETKLPSRSCHNSETAAVITYTGGTTGGSKGAILSNKAVISVAFQYSMSEKNLSRESTWMQVLPLFIAYGITSSVMVALSVGMKQIIRIPMSESIAEFCKKFKPNHVLYSPAYWEKLAIEKVDLDLSNFIAPTTGGDVLRPSIEEKVNTYLLKHGCSCPLMNGYGMTEVGAGVSLNFPHAHKFGSVGIPFAKNIISTFDPNTSEELKYGEIGELCINTPSMMIGYLNNKDETDNIIRKHSDGMKWVHSGDLGYIDEDGFVFVIGRMKRYFAYAVNGVHKKVFCIDIEKSLLRCSLIENCAVVPVSNAKTVQAAIAYIITKNKQDEDFSTVAQIKSFGEKNLKESHRPIKYYIVDKFPLTKIGKVDYIALEKMAQENENKL